MPKRERGRFDMRTDPTLERVLEWIEGQLRYNRPRALRWAAWNAARTLGMPDLPGVDEMVNVKVGRKPKAPTPPAAPPGGPDGEG